MKKRILMTVAALAASALLLTAPAHATEQAATDNGGFGTAQFTNQSPAGFNDPVSWQSDAAVASMADKVSAIEPAAGDDSDAPVPPAAVEKAAQAIAPAVSGVTPPLSAPVK